MLDPAACESAAQPFGDVPLIELPLTRPVYVVGPALNVISSPRSLPSVIGTVFVPFRSVPDTFWKVCVSARRVRDRSAGVGELRLKIVGFPTKVFTDPDPGSETCLNDRDFADAVRDTKSIEARVYDVRDKPIANGRLKQPKDNGRRDGHPDVKPL